MLDPIREVAPHSQPWMPLRYPSGPEGLEAHARDAAAARAVYDGRATPDQQRRMWDLVVYRLGMIDDLEFRPGGDDGRRSSDFASGRRWVGLQLRRYLAINARAMMPAAYRPPPDDPPSDERQQEI